MREPFPDNREALVPMSEVLTEIQILKGQVPRPQRTLDRGDLIGCVCPDPFIGNNNFIGIGGLGTCTLSDEKDAKII
jgi:hypothetical protein